MLKNMHIFARLDQNLIDLSNRIIKNTILELKEKLNQFKISDQNLCFPLEQFLKTNAAILEAIDLQTPKNELQSNELMKLYLKEVPTPQIIGKLMKQLFSNISTANQDDPFAAQTQNPKSIDYGLTPCIS